MTLPNKFAKSRCWSYSTRGRKETLGRVKKRRRRSMNGYLELPTSFNSGVNYVQFNNGSYTNVNGEAFGISGSSTIGSMLGINSSIQNNLNSNADAVNAGNALSGAVDNCDFGSGGSTGGGTT